MTRLASRRPVSDDAYKWAKKIINDLLLSGEDDIFFKDGAAEGDEYFSVADREKSSPLILKELREAGLDARAQADMLKEFYLKEVDANG